MVSGGMARSGLVLSLLLGLMWLCGGCSPKETMRYHYFEQLPRGGWRQSHEVFFSTSELDSGELYDVDLVLRVDRDFRYSEIPIGVTFETPSRHISTHRVSIPIEEDKLRSGGYALNEHRIRLAEGVRYGEVGVYTYSVRQLSTDSVLPGVVDVGLTIRVKE